MHDFHHPRSNLPIRSRDPYFAMLVGRLFDKKSESDKEQQNVKHGDQEEDDHPLFNKQSDSDRIGQSKFKDDKSEDDYDQDEFENIKSKRTDEEHVIKKDKVSPKVDKAKMETPEDNSSADRSVEGWFHRFVRLVVCEAVRSPDREYDPQIHHRRLSSHVTATDRGPRLTRSA